MTRKRGRDDYGKHRRMRSILSALTVRGHLGVTARRLERAAGLSDMKRESARRTLMRYIKELRTSGWIIDSVKRNDEDVFVLRVIDRRIQQTFTGPEREQLLRAAQRAGLGQLYEDLDPELSDRTPAEVDYRLAVVQEAIALRCRLSFTYNGKARELHPYDLNRKPKGWLLRGREVTGTTTKNFYVLSMDEVAPRRPGTAEDIPEDLDPLTLDPMRWLVHDPITVAITCQDADTDDITALLGPSRCRVIVDGDSAVVEAEITNTDAFLSRLFELGHRARLVGPPEVRDTARAHLNAIVEAFG